MPKYLRIKEALADRLQTMRAGDALPSMAELRAEFGVALGTMDRALRELRRDGLIDVRHGTGIYSTGRQQTVQLGICFGFDILESEAGVYPRLLLQGLTKHESLDPSIICRHYFAAGSGQYWATRFDLLQRDVEAGLVDAVILAGVYFGQLKDLDVPIVGLDALPDVSAHVRQDRRGLVRLALAALAEAGHRRIAFAGGHRDTPLPADDPAQHIAHEQIAAMQEFRSETARLGLETRDDWIPAPTYVPDAFIGQSGVTQQGRQMAAAIAADPGDLPDAIVSTDDYRAVGICQELTARGIVVGRDIHVATMANRGSPVLDGLPVIRLEVDPAEIALALIRSATGLIADTLVDGHITYVPPKVILP